MMVFYMLVLLLVARRSPIAWLKSTAPLYATTAATCSSLASLVVSMNIAEKRLKIPDEIYSFTLPLGAQLNKDGTSIMLVTVLLFTAQAAGVEFTLAQQVTIVLVGLLLSEGSGGIPGGGLVIALIFVEAFSLPIEIAGIVAGVYRLVDMGSTTINCMGDLAWTTTLSDIEARRTARREST
jgi:Na+/H+-dicarboxylate symporter